MLPEPLLNDIDSIFPFDSREVDPKKIDQRLEHDNLPPLPPSQDKMTELEQDHLIRSVAKILLEAVQAAEVNKNSMDSPGKYPCIFAIYGCADAFATKNEWKRHMKYQHIRAEYWECTSCKTGEAVESVKGVKRSKRFWRPDLMLAHARRVHQAQPRNSGDCLEYRKLPSDCACTIPTCCETFKGDNAWRDRVEHIGEHFKDNYSGEWQPDEALHKYLTDQGIIVWSESQRWELVKQDDGEGSS